MTDDTFEQEVMQSTLPVLVDLCAPWCGPCKAIAPIVEELTEVRCTDEVMHRMRRIPIPFVRQMVIQKVADAARHAGVPRVDVPFFERAANF